jgi:fructose-bisphosphate aldolase class II
MALEPMTEILARAREGGYAVGYFEAWDTYSLEAVVDAAEAEQAPVILGFGCLLVEQQWLEDGGIETLGCIGRHAAARARVPVALLLNEAHKLEHALRGIEAGFNAVMLCTNDVDVTAGLVAQAHERGVAVEAEVGELPAGASDGEVDTSHAALTDPDEAAEFVAATGVDCLGVSFGNVHTLEGRVASVDLDRLAAIRDCVEVPLVVHGGSAFPADAVAGAIARGVAKFNIGTVLKRAYLDVLSTAVISVGKNESPHDIVGSHGPRDVLAAGKPRVVDAVRARIRLYGASGRAT